MTVERNRSTNGGDMDDYWSKDIVERLYERSDAAQSEGTGTAISDATHFRQAAAEIERLRKALSKIYDLIDDEDGADIDYAIALAETALAPRSV